MRWYWRIIGVVAGLGLDLDDRVSLAIHGWVAYVEECVVRWIADPVLPRAKLLDLLTKSLPALALSASDEDVGTLVSILSGDRVGPAG